MAHQPQNLVATATSSTTIDLSWDDVETLDDEFYDVERDGVIIESAQVGTTYSDTGLDADTEYTYRVRAVGGTEVGGDANVTPSTVVTATTVLTIGVDVVTFSPDDVAGLVAWYDFSDISTLWQDTTRTTPITADGQEVAGVTDASGTAHHLGSGTGGERALYKVNIQNGLSIVRFDGINDQLTTGGISTPSADTSWTVLIVAIKRSAPTATADPLFATNASSQLFARSTESATAYLWYSTQTGTVLTMTGAVTSWGIPVLRINSAASMDFFVSGGTPTNLNPHDIVTTSTLWTLGRDTASAYGDFDVGEVVIYDSALSASDLNLVGSYLADRWAITWTTVT